MDKLRFLVPRGSAYRRHFAGFITALLDVKSLVEHIEGLAYNTSEHEVVLEETSSEYAVYYMSEG